MLTKIDLCSMALLKLGEPTISSLTDDSTAAQLSRTLFDPVVDALIAAHPWRFAIKSFDLTPTTDGDFEIPTNVLRVIKCPGQIIGTRIVASGDSINILATTRVAPSEFPGYFVSLVATKLAMEFCIPLVGDQTVFRMLAALYESELQSAKYLDSSISPSPRIDDFSLVNIRF
ncbi:MAG: hypothetical protein IJX89_01900 [Alphaproteobacteria bacterium]|nr:hypothetical protein [Alphaproteobacteria bacterium]